MSTTTYDVAGTYSFVVPDQCTEIEVILNGAGGGFATSVVDTAGGQVSGTLVVTPGETLQINVGGLGGIPPNDGTGAAGAGGFNGGGPGGTALHNPSAAGPGGGGATDIRQGGTALANRKAVAAGGGGSGRFAYGAGGQGGAATGQAGAAGATAHGSPGGAGGTGAAGGTGGAAVDGGSAGGNGSSGQGGHGGLVSTTGGVAGAGGGGGYFGGGASGASPNATADSAGSGGGGGGSNYIGGLTGTATARGTGGTRDGSVSLSYNMPPNAPDLILPVNNANLDQTQSQTFEWTFSDPDVGDAAGQSDFRYRVGTGAWTTITDAVSGALTFLGFAANFWASLTGQRVEWQVRVYDQGGGAVSPWSDSSFFTPCAEPAPATITSAAVGSNTPGVGWTTPAPMASYRLRVVNDVAGSPGSTVYVDTGEIMVSAGPEIELAVLPFFAYSNGSSYHIQVTYTSPAGVWASSWADSGALVADVNAPLQPTAVVTANPTNFSIIVEITNPGSDPFPPAYNDIYRTDLTRGSAEVRIATQLPLGDTYIDNTPGFNTDYRYRVVAVTSTGATTSSE